jgi:hypothetical protein
MMDFGQEWLKEHRESKFDPICMEMYGAPEEVIGEAMLVARSAIRSGDCMNAFVAMVGMQAKLAALTGCQGALNVTQEIERIKRAQEGQQLGIRRPTWGKVPSDLNG